MKIFIKFMIASALTAMCAISLPAIAGPYEDGLAMAEAKNYAQAVNKFTPLANEGNAQAQFELAKLYISGLLTDGVDTGGSNPTTKKQGGDWLRRASDNGLVEAQREMNVLYIIQGYGVSLEEGKKYQRMAARQGDAGSQYFVGLDYRDDKNYTLAREWLEKSVYQGNENAAKALDELPFAELPPVLPKGFSLYDRAPPTGPLTSAQIKQAEEAGLQAYLAGNYARSIKLWSPAAKAGSAVAQTNLAIQYVNRQGTERSQEKIMYWLEKAMAQNHEHAFRVVGTLHSKGILFPASKQRAFEFYKKSSDLGSASGAHDAAQMADSRGNETQALTLFTLAANRGHARAQAVLGLNYENGFGGVEVDYKKSAEYYLKSAQQGFPFSVYLTGENYRRGRGVDKSEPLAKYWLKRGARGGDGACMASLDIAAQAEVKTELFLILKASAERGGAPAQHRLGMAYKNGDGVEKSTHLAKQWLGKAAAQDHSLAMLELAKMYDHFRIKGEITPKAKALYTRLAAKKWEPRAVVKRAKKAYDQGNFLLARALGQPYADIGDKYAQDLMGRIYGFGLGVPESKEKSEAYFKHATVQGLTGTGDVGHTQAQYKLGFIYDLNRNEPVQAALWYRKAASKEHADALYSLAVLYNGGRGVPKNQQKAIKLFKRAYVAGNDNAERYLETIQAVMRRDKRRNQRLAREQNTRRQQAIEASRDLEEERLDREYQQQLRAKAAKEQAAAQTRTYTYPKPKRNKWSFNTMITEAISGNNNSGYSQPFSYSGSSSSSYGYSSGSTYSSSSSSTKSYYSTYTPKPYVNPYTYRYKSAWEISGPKYYD